MSEWALRLIQFFLIGALMVSMGGHLAILQTFAWGNMLMSYSTETSLSDAVDKTFDNGSLSNYTPFQFNHYRHFHEIILFSLFIDPYDWHCQCTNPEA